MKYLVEYTDQFEDWWNTLDAIEQRDVALSVALLENNGPNLPFPYSSSVHASRHSHMLELRTQSKGRPLRTLYAFDPRRVAILLIGGDKTGQNDWYEHFVPIADKLYDEHLKEIAKGD